MNKEELIKLYEEKLKSYQNEAKSYAKMLDYDSAYRFHMSSISVKVFLQDLKNLNEETVKRKELIDFFTHYSKLNFHKPHSTECIKYVVDDYLKSINE
ncbi:MAG: hypothetical protein ACXAC7_23200 [Candidatus Hodarchaeales archaeon]|jgi:uncharacterized protein YbgA (DUF1722 family)